MKERWEILCDLITKHNFKVIAEIGVNRGINASNLLAICPCIEEMYLVDLPSNNVFDIGLFQDNKTINKIKYLSIGSELASKELPNDLDLVFIDAAHGYIEVKQDIELWLPKLRKGGIICGHDYIDYIEYGVKQAVHEYFPNINLESDVLENGELKIWWTYV